MRRHTVAANHSLMVVLYFYLNISFTDRRDETNDLVWIKTGPAPFYLRFSKLEILFWTELFYSKEWRIVGLIVRVTVIKSGNPVWGVRFRQVARQTLFWFFYHPGAFCPFYAFHNCLYVTFSCRDVIYRTVAIARLSAPTLELFSRCTFQWTGCFFKDNSDTTPDFFWESNVLSSKFHSICTGKTLQKRCTISWGHEGTVSGKCEREKTFKIAQTSLTASTSTVYQSMTRSTLCIINSIPWPSRYGKNSSIDQALRDWAHFLLKSLPSLSV